MLTLFLLLPPKMFFLSDLLPPWKQAKGLFGGAPAWYCSSTVAEPPEPLHAVAERGIRMGGGAKLARS